MRNRSAVYSLSTFQCAPPSKRQKGDLLEFRLDSCVLHFASFTIKRPSMQTGRTDLQVSVFGHISKAAFSNTKVISDSSGAIEQKGRVFNWTLLWKLHRVNACWCARCSEQFRAPRPSHFPAQSTSGQRIQVTEPVDAEGQLFTPLALAGLSWCWPRTSSLTTSVYGSSLQGPTATSDLWLHGFIGRYT